MASNQTKGNLKLIKKTARRFMVGHFEAENEKLLKEIEETPFDEESGLLRVRALQRRYCCQCVFDRSIQLGLAFLFTVAGAMFVALVVVTIKNK